MVIRRFTIKDYPIVESWWEKHGAFPLSLEYYSKTGIIVEGTVPLCAGWLYDTDSAICVFEFVVCNPDAPREERNKGLNELIKHIIKLAQKRNYKLIYSSVKGEKYIKRLMEQGFVEVDKEQTHCFYKIG